jgi:hypothetical protein
MLSRVGVIEIQTFFSASFTIGLREAFFEVKEKWMDRVGLGFIEAAEVAEAAVRLVGSYTLAF